MKLRENKGVTLMILVIMIIVLLIIAGISIYSGTETIKRAKLEELKTNMLLIEAKAKEYVEQANFKMGVNPDEAKKQEVRTQVYITDGKLEKTDVTLPNGNNLNECYYVTQDTMKLWGLDKIKLEDDEKYLIKFDETNISVEVYNTLGYNGKYSLTDIDQIQE